MHSVFFTAIELTCLIESISTNNPRIEWKKIKNGVPSYVYFQNKIAGKPLGNSPLLKTHQPVRPQHSKSQDSKLTQWMVPWKNLASNSVFWTVKSHCVCERAIVLSFFPLWKGDLEHRAQLREPANILIFNTTRSDTAEYRCEVAAIDDQRDFDEILISLAVRGMLSLDTTSLTSPWLAKTYSTATFTLLWIKQNSTVHFGNRRFSSLYFHIIITLCLFGSENQYSSYTNLTPYKRILSFCRYNKFIRLSVLMLNWAEGPLAVASYGKDRCESGIDILMSLSARRQDVCISENL